MTETLYNARGHYLILLPNIIRNRASSVAQTKFLLAENSSLLFSKNHKLIDLTNKDAETNVLRSDARSLWPKRLIYY